MGKEKTFKVRKRQEELDQDIRIIKDKLSQCKELEMSLTYLKLLEKLQHERRVI